MNRYPGPPPTNNQGQPLSSVGVYPPPGMSGHMPSPQAVPPYNVAVASPSQYGQPPVAGPSPTPTHYAHPSVIKTISSLPFDKIKTCFYLDFNLFYQMFLKIDLSSFFIIMTINR